MTTTNATHGMSSSYYVPMRLREGPADAPVTPTSILSSARCGHEWTVCPSCVDQWELDWAIYFHRTVGGTRLLAARGLNEAAEGMHILTLTTGALALLSDLLDTNDDDEELAENSGATIATITELRAAVAAALEGSKS